MFVFISYMSLKVSKSKISHHVLLTLPRTQLVFYLFYFKKPSWPDPPVILKTKSSPSSSAANTEPIEAPILDSSWNVK